MRFNLVDRIVAVEPGRSLRAVKNLTLAEEYLADHFPTFPVMPGVLMLQTLVEAATWLLRITDDFAQSVIVLRQAKGVKFGSFMEPGKQLVATVELTERDGGQAIFKAKAEMDGMNTVAARLIMEGYNLRSRSPALARVDERLIDEQRARLAVLWSNETRAATAASLRC